MTLGKSFLPPTRMWRSGLLLLFLLASPVSSSLTTSGGSMMNETSLECGMRKMALEYAMTLVDDPDVLQTVHDALRLQDLCNLSGDDVFSRRPPSAAMPASVSDQRRRKLNTATTADDGDATNNDLCSNDDSKNGVVCIYLEVPSKHSGGNNLRHQTGSVDRPWTDIQDALVHARSIIRKNKQTPGGAAPKVVLRDGIHSFGSRPLKLTEEDNGLTLQGFPGEHVWISGGISLHEIHPEPIDGGVYVYDLKDALATHTIPRILSLFTTNRRYTRARYPNSDPEVDQWGYSSPHRLNYSIASSLVLEWYRPPPTTPPDFTLVDFRSNPPPGVPAKNDSAQEGYNWYASGQGGACIDVWGPDANSYWCSNASQGGWSEVDRECAEAGQMQLPIGMAYNLSSPLLSRFRNLTGGILHAWHSQSWAMHMFSISDHSKYDGEMTFAKGGGRQGGRNWCRCDQCTYAGRWCGQHQDPPWHDTRMISGTWMVENVLEELDQPGEYFFDHDTMKLYVKPNSTLDLIDFRIGLSETIVDIQGASNVTIQNIGFRDTAPTYMSDQWSAPSGGDWSLHRGGAVFVENAENIIIQNCAFRRLDGNAVFLSRRTRNVRIEESEFSWIGENAIATWGDTDDYDGRAENFPMYTLVQNNVMRELGIYQKQSSGVGQCKAALTTIRNNIMFNTPRAAINFNDMLGGGDIIDGNLIFNTCRESGDHGPINTWDRQPFLTTLRDGETASFDPIPREIHRNFIFANYGASQGVDNDDGSSWYHIHHNVFYAAEGFKMDYGGHDSVFEDNLVMAYPYDGSQCYGVGRFFEGHGDLFQNNRCLVGLGHKRGSGCGDPTCADPEPADDESRVLIGTVWGGCENSSFGLNSNSYYTPTGTANISCAGDDYSLEDVQIKFELETGSTVDTLPDENTILQWAKEILGKGDFARLVPTLMG